MASITTPVTVVAQPYDTSSNGGRKLVRLSNGWLVAGAMDSLSGNVIYFYVSKDGGQSWQPLCNVGMFHDNGFAIATDGTNIYCVISHSGHGKIYFASFNALTTPNKQYTSTELRTIDSNQQDLGACSLVISTDGTLHAAWASKNSTYPNSFNIRYSKSTDGGQTWASPTQITTTNNSVNYVDSPVIVERQGFPHIICRYVNTSTTNYSIYDLTTEFTTKANSALSVTPWGNQVIYSVGTYAQTSPCAVVDSAGVIHVVWDGGDATSGSVFNIQYSKSTDGGVTWSAVEKLTSGNQYGQRQPSVTVNKSNTVFVYWIGLDSAHTTTYNLKRVSNNGSGWGAIETLTDYSGGGSFGVRWPSTLMDKDLNFSEPLTIYQDLNASDVKFRGAWTTVSIAITGKSFPTVSWEIDGGGDTITETRLKVNGTTKTTVQNPTGEQSYTFDLTDFNNGDNTIIIEADTATSTEKKTLIANKSFTFKHPLEIVPNTFSVDAKMSVVATGANENYVSMLNEGTEIVDEGIAETTFIGTTTIPYGEGTVRLTASRQDETIDNNILMITGGMS
jgi:hypothetical protein